MSTIKANTIQPLSDSTSVVVRTNAQDSLTVDSSGNITVRNEAVIDGINIGLGGGGVSTNLRVGTSAFGGGANSGANNTAIGYTSLRDHSSGTNNVGVGSNSLLLLTNGSNNTGIGYGAGNTITVNSQNTCIGSGADVSSISIANSVAIGYNSSAATSNSVYLGNASTTSLYMGNGSVVAPLYGARAWAVLSGNGAAVPTIIGAGNISTVTRENFGRYTLTFTTAMPSTNYSVVCTTDNNADGSGLASSSKHVTKTASSFGIMLGNNGTNNFEDLKVGYFYYVAVFA